MASFDIFVYLCFDFFVNCKEHVVFRNTNSKILENVQYWEKLTTGAMSTPKNRRNNPHQFWERLTHSDAFWSDLEHTPRHVIAAQKPGFRPKRQNKRQNIRKPKIGSKYCI